MKRSLLGVCGILLATAVIAQADVASVNVVGFNKMTFEKGKLYLVATAFEDIDGKALKSNDVFANQLPNGSQIFFYDGVTPYQIDTKTVVGWGTNITYSGFMGFWVKVNPLAANPSYDVVLKGQVPMDNTVSNMIASGLNMLGYPFTADVAFSNTTLYAQANNGDQIFVFNPATQNYAPSPYTKTVAGWPVAARQLVLTQGVGFWYKSSRVSPILDVETRPYPPAN